MEAPSEVHDERYRAEQTKLLQKHEGLTTTDEEGLVIDVPKDPEVNPEVYKDVEPILFRGFLLVQATINDVPVVFKSLNHHEFERVRLLSGSDEGHTSRFWQVFLAHSVYFFDGVNVLVNRDRSVTQLLRLFEEIPRPARDRIIRPLSEVNRRATNAIRLTEAFSMEWQSRYRWTQLKGLDPTSTAVTGIEGTEKLGLNWGQLTWRALNQYEDMRDQHEREWENAKFVGSCSAGKGISKVYHQDTERRQKEKEQRFARKDMILREVLFGDTSDGTKQQKYGAVLVVAHTAEELAAQLTRDLRGEKDFHDLVVDQAQQQTQRIDQAHQQRTLEMARMHEEEMGGRFLTGSTDMTGLTAAEVRQRTDRQTSYNAQVAAQRVVHPAMDGPDGDATFKEKWGLSGGVPVQVSTTDQDTSTAISVPPVRLRQTPFRRG